MPTPTRLPSLAAMLAEWGQFRHPSAWPYHCKLAPDALVYHIVKSHPSGLSLSGLMVVFKASVGCKANLDMLNLKAYLQCFPHHFRFMRVGQIDYIHDALATLEPMSDKEYMRLYGLDKVFAQGIRQARLRRVPDPAFFVAQHLLQASPTAAAQAPARPLHP